MRAFNTGNAAIVGAILETDTGFAQRQQALVRVHRKLYTDWSRKRWGATGGYNALHNPEQALREANEVGEQGLNCVLWLA